MIVFDEKTSVVRLVNEDIKKRYYGLKGETSQLIPVFLDNNKTIHADVFNHLEIELNVGSAIDRQEAENNAAFIFQETLDNIESKS